MSEFKRFIIVQRPNGLSKYVMNHGATYNLTPDREYIPVIEYAALQACEARLESANAEIERLEDKLRHKDHAMFNQDEEISHLKQFERMHDDMVDKVMKLTDRSIDLASELEAANAENAKLRAALEMVDAVGMIEPYDRLKF